MKANITLFMGANSAFSHWYPASFVVDGKVYDSASQYLMHKKAILFEDPVTAARILKSADPVRHRRLGRGIAKFDKGIWQDNCMQYSFEANQTKFSQNSALEQMLLATGRSILAEASPYDRVWGIGLSLSNPKALIPELWRGRNLAGLSLMAVRDSLEK